MLIFGFTERPCLEREWEVREKSAPYPPLRIPKHAFMLVEVLFCIKLTGTQQGLSRIFLSLLVSHLLVYSIWGYGVFLQYLRGTKIASQFRDIMCSP